ncbi:hypothetical protein GEMRC1_006365 [Eukaryota sp. GEM-RC1]
MSHYCCVCKTIRPCNDSLCDNNDHYIYPCNICDTSSSSYHSTAVVGPQCSESRYISPKSIHVPHSILVLINYHILRNVLLTSTKEVIFPDAPDFHFSYSSVSESDQQNLDNGPFISVDRLSPELLTCIQKVGYVSRQFLESAIGGVQVFLESNTVRVFSQQLPFIVSLSSFFKCEIKSVFLTLRSSFEVQDIIKYTSIISHLKVPFFRELLLILNPSSPQFLPHLLRLDIEKKRSDDSFGVFCEFLTINTTIKEFNLLFGTLTSDEATSLGKVFYSNKTLTKLYLFSDPYPAKDNELLVLFSALGRNSVIQTIDLSDIGIGDSTILVPLLNSSTMSSLRFPSDNCLGTSVFTAIMNSTSLREIAIETSDSNANGLVEVLSTDTYLRKLTILPFSSSYSSIFKSLEQNSTLSELVVNVRWQDFNDDETESLVVMIRKNIGLLYLNLESVFLNLPQIKKILDGVQSNLVLRKLSLLSRGFDLTSIKEVFETKYRHTLKLILNINSNIIDIKNGVFNYSPESKTILSASQLLSIKCFYSVVLLKNLF